MKETQAEVKKLLNYLDVECELRRKAVARAELAERQYSEISASVICGEPPPEYSNYDEPPQHRAEDPKINSIPIIDFH